MKPELTVLYLPIIGIKLYLLFVIVKWAKTRENARNRVSWVPIQRLVQVSLIATL